MGLPVPFPTLPWGPVLPCLLPLSLYPSWVIPSSLPKQRRFPSLPSSFSVCATILLNRSHLVLGPLGSEYIPTVSFSSPECLLYMPSDTVCALTHSMILLGCSPHSGCHSLSFLPQSILLQTSFAPRFGPLQRHLNIRS